MAERQTLHVAGPGGSGRSVPLTLPSSATLREVLDAACSALRLERRPDYGLAHGRRRLGPLASTTLRLAGLPAGAHVEIVEERGRPSETVSVVVVDSATGARAQPVAVPRDAALGATLRAAGAAAVGVTPRGIETAAVQIGGTPVVVHGLALLGSTTVGALAANASSLLLRVSLRPETIAMDDAERIVDSWPAVCAPDARAPRTAPKPTAAAAAAPSSVAAAAATPPVERRAVLHTISGSPACAPDVPAEEYDVTAAQVAAAHAEAAARVRSLADAPLVSRSAQERQRRAELAARYPVSRIRFRMARSATSAGAECWIEASFSSGEPASALHAFVRTEVLRGADAPFVLRTPPPARDILPGATHLLDLGLVPAAVILVVMGTDRAVDVGHIPQLAAASSSSSDRDASVCAVSASDDPPHPRDSAAARPSAAGAGSSLKKPAWLRL